MRELHDLPLGPRWDLGDAHESPALTEAHREAHRRGLLSLSDALVAGPEHALAMTWATPELALFPVRTPTLLPATHTNVVFVVSAGEAVLIEPATPYDDELERLLHAVAELARRGIRVKEIWATHHHPDHVGGAQAITRALGLPLRAHPETLARLDPAIPQGHAIIEGDRLRVGALSLEALHVPGHAIGHLAFFEPKLGAVIAGDMVAAVGTILIEPGEGHMATYLRSLERLAALDARVVLPAHGGAIRPGREVFERYIAHRLLREARVLEALGPTPRGLDELVAIAYEDTPPHVWPIALLSLEAHLVKLVEEGRAQRSGQGWST